MNLYLQSPFVFFVLQGETDWKVMAIVASDPLAENLNDINDVEKLMPGFLAVGSKLI